MKTGKWYDFTSLSLNEVKKFGGVISPSAFICDDFKLCFPVHISPGAQIKNNVRIDRFTFLNWNTIVYPNVYIGAYCSIGRNVEIGLAAHPVDWLSTHSFQYSDGWFPNLKDYRSTANMSYKHLHHKKVNIGSDVWIGNGAKVMSGLTIGHGSIIGAGSVVTKNVEPYSIVGGVPAKLIKYRFDESLIKELLRTKWWTLKHEVISQFQFTDIKKVIKEIDAFRCQSNE